MTRERSPMDDLFDLQDGLRHFAVWQHTTETFSADGQKRLYPRFIAVIKDEAEFKASMLFARAVEEALKEEEMSDRWVPTYFNEVWMYATLRVSDAYRSKRFHDGYIELELPVCREELWPEQKAKWVGHVKELDQHIPIKSHDFRVLIEGGKVLAVLKLQARQAFTVRQASGGHYRMYGVSVDGVQHQGVKCGIVVLRGFEGTVQVNPPRKRRTDLKEAVYRIPPLGITFYP